MAKFLHADAALKTANLKIHCEEPIPYHSLYDEHLMVVFLAVILNALRQFA